MPFSLPFTLSSFLQEKYSSLSTEKELGETLLASPLELMDFFGQMCEDEEWCEEHPHFTRLLLEGFTERLFQNKLLSTFAATLGKVVQRHIKVLQPLLSENISFEIEGKLIRENSFLLGANSPFFQELIVREFRDLNKPVYVLQNVSLTTYSSIRAYIATGDTKELWKLSFSQLEDTLKKSREWELFELAEECEKKLAKYIERKNVFETLIRAHHADWKFLKEACYQLINAWNLGLHFVSEEGMTVEFLNFKERAMELFEEVRPYVRRLIMSGSLANSPEFEWVVKNTPHLVGIDLSRSQAYPTYLGDVPSTLEELDLSMCNWLENEDLKRISESYPQLHRLRIRSNTQLNFRAWGYLQKFSLLTELDISGCEQIFDEDVKMIIRACPRLTTFSCEDCKNVSEKGFYEMAGGFPQLNYLNVSRNFITDSALIEIAIRCHFLRELVTTRCLRLTHKGVINVVKHCLSLKYFNVSQCFINGETIEEAKRLRPHLKIDFNQSKESFHFEG